MLKDITAIILAAGDGTRMCSDVPKVLHKICARPMIGYLLDTLEEAGVKDLTVVAGYKGEEVARFLGTRARVVFQKKRLGTADAVKQAQHVITKTAGNILVLCADTPLLTKETIEKLVAVHNAEDASCTVLTAQMKNPTGYGRIKRDSKGRVAGIIEEQEADVYQKAIEEINVGAYCFNARSLFSNILKIKPSPKKGEYYLTDIIGILIKDGDNVSSLKTEDPEEALGVNSRDDLARASQTLRRRTINKLQQKGVTIVDPATTYIDWEAKIGKDTIIYPMTTIEQGVSIGSCCEIGPYARLRSGTVVEDRVNVGNFVELNRTSIGSKTTIAHNTYLGDTQVGKNVNIGAGTITANYDGKAKYKTIIEDGAFIGSGTILVAPVKVGKSAVTGAGAVVPKNKNVPAGAVVVGVPARLLKNSSRSSGHGGDTVKISKRRK